MQARHVSAGSLKPPQDSHDNAKRLSGLAAPPLNPLSIISWCVPWSEREARRSQVGFGGATSPVLLPGGSSITPTF